MNEEFFIRALALHAALTSRQWVGMPIADRVEMFELALDGYAKRAIGVPLLLNLLEMSEAWTETSSS